LFNTKKSLSLYLHIQAKRMFVDLGPAVDRICKIRLDRINNTFLGILIIHFLRFANFLGKCKIADDFEFVEGDIQPFMQIEINEPEESK
jgi:hypothetical protein